jgi:hypothetical protein
MENNTSTIQVENYWDSDYPSKIEDSYWVATGCDLEILHPRKFRDKAKSSFGNISELKVYLSERKSGKWLVFVDISELDETWQIIKKATKEGILGIGAKASTAKKNENASSHNEKVICVYTYNWLDKEDVFRVEKMLRSIGINQTLFYKADSDTEKGKYKNQGDKNISKYISQGTIKLKKYSLNTLNGIGFDKVKILNNIGIKNFDDLLNFDTSKKINGVGVSTKYISKLKLSALSQIENKIFKITDFNFPETDILHFDIETDIYTSYETKRVWSIAVYHKNKILHFYAEKWEQEKFILTEFVKYLKGCQNTAIFSYSPFDVNVLKYALTRHQLDTNFFINLNHYDLCALLKQNYILPLDSYSIKEVGKLLGYKYKREDLGGLMVAMEYMNTQRVGKMISKDLLNYIYDDVKVMNHIVEKIKTGENIKDIFDHNTDGLK